MIKAIILGCLLSLTSACSHANSLSLKGKILLKGPAPHSYLVIEDQRHKKSYKIKNDSFQQLIKKQNWVCSIKAELIEEARGPRLPAVIQVLEVKDCH
jgi:hypothetical protein